jgi:hypothetical protein
MRGESRRAKRIGFSSPLCGARRERISEHDPADWRGLFHEQRIGICPFQEPVLILLRAHAEEPKKVGNDEEETEDEEKEEEESPAEEEEEEEEPEDVS